VIKVESYGHITNGVMKIAYRDRFFKAIKQLPDCRIRMTVEKLYKKRSTLTYNEELDRWGRGQNGYYWTVVIYEFCEGYYEINQEQMSKEYAHEILKRECNYKEIHNNQTGEILRIGKSTANLTTVQFEEYLERCRQFIFEWFGRSVPMPDVGQLELEFMPQDEMKMKLKPEKI
jgi:hypothetical protein